MSKTVKIVILIAWFIVINILFCLPGSAFPSDDWLDKIWFDKWVHIGIFSALIFLFIWAFYPLAQSRIVILVFAALAYGLLIEFIQKNFIPNRGFDLVDWAADTIGILTGLFIWKRFKKSKAL